MNEATLRAELLNDPLGRGYGLMTDAEVVTSLQTADRAVERTIVESWEVLEATVPAEWAALSAAEKQRYQTIIGAGKVNTKGANTRQAFAAMFGPGTQTRTNLQALQNGQPMTRAEELGLGKVGEHHVSAARPPVPPGAPLQVVKGR